MARKFQGSLPGVFTLVLTVVLAFAFLYIYAEYDLLQLTFPNATPDLMAMQLDTIHPAITELIIISCIIALVGMAVGFLLGKTHARKMPEGTIFLQALDAIPDSVEVEKLSDSTLMWVNSGFTELTGYTREEALGQSVVGLELWPDNQQRKKLIADLKNKRSCNHFETIRQRKNGEHVQVLISATVIKFNGIPCVFLIATNLANREQTRNELIAAEVRYKNFIRSAGYGIIRYECETPFSILTPLQEQKAALANAIIKECNASACNILNFNSPDELIGMRYGKLANIGDAYRHNVLDAYISNNYVLSDYIISVDGEPGKGKMYISIFATGLIENGQHKRAWITMTDVTQKIQIEKALKASEEKFSKTFHATGDVVIITSLEDEKIIDANQEIYHTLGFRPEEVIGKCSTELNLYANPAERTEIFDMVRRGISISNRKIRVRKKSGEIIITLFSTKKIRLQNQACLIATSQDITHIHEAEEKLYRYEKISAAINDAVVVMDDSFNYEYVNAPYLRFIGESEADIIGKNIADVLRTEKFVTLKSMLEDALGGAVVTFERWNNMHTDESTCYEITMMRYKDSDDGKWHVLSIGRDITDKKQIEHALLQNERRYQSILNATNAIPWEVNLKDWKTTYIGSQIRDQLGYEPEAWMRHDLWMKNIDPADRQEVRDFYRSVDLNDTFGEIQYRIYDSANNTKWVRDIVRPVTDKKGNRLLQGTMVDMTESKEKDDQLSQAQKMEAVGRLTGGVAHDFNNLLTVIRGNISLLLEKFAGKDPETEEMLADALSASDDGAELTEQLLAFSSKQSLKPQVVEINKQVEHAARLFRRMITEDIDFTISLAKNNPIVYIDPTKFDNAVLNLMINARDAMESSSRAGVINITVDQETVTSPGKAKTLNIKPGEYITVSVTDNGCGMDAKIIKQVCEPFFTTKAPDKGSGLGLSMVYGFVNQSEGSLAISSQPDVGTSISLYMPEYTDHDTHHDDAAADENTPIIAAENIKETVLVIEDETRVRKFAVKCLQSLGYRVLEAHDAKSAITMLESNPTIDVLFSDNILPGGMNGRELAAWALQNYPNIKVILATGFSEHETDGASVYDGTFPLLRKPYSKEELTQQIHELIEQQEAVYQQEIRH